MNAIALERSNERYRGEYVFSDEYDWFSGNVPVWEDAIADFKGRPDIHYLEVGVFEGRSYVWMAENVFTHPTSTMTAVDLFTGFEDVSGETVKATFLENVRRAGVSNRSTLYTGYSQLEMRKLPLDSFDVIYVDGAHDAANVLEDAMLCRRLLKDGGVIIFDDYDWPINPGVKFAVDTFVQIYGEDYSIVHRGYQLILRKGERS
jgi:predicted O-methyltransferase YrrM